jgi:hypothetical protein
MYMYQPQKKYQSLMCKVVLRTRVCVSGSFQKDSIKVPKVGTMQDEVCFCQRRDTHT